MLALSAVFLAFFAVAQADPATEPKGADNAPRLTTPDEPAGAIASLPRRPDAAALDVRDPYRRWTRFGVALFAGSLAVLILGGGRELLHPSRRTLLVALAVIAAIGITRVTSPLFTVAVGLFGMTMLTVVHAASAAIRKNQPGARGRILVMTLALLATAGATLAISVQTQALTAGSNSPDRRQS